MAHRFKRGGNIWKQFNLSLECPDPPIQNNSDNDKKMYYYEPQVDWDSNKNDLPASGLTFSPLQPSTKKEQKDITPKTTPSSQSTNSKKRKLRRENSVYRSRNQKEDDDLLKKIHEAAQAQLQNHIETYVKRRESEKRKRKSINGNESEDYNMLFSPKTALARDAAKFTPSKRRKFFQEARLYGQSQFTTPHRRNTSVCDASGTPRRPKEPLTSTPLHRAENRLKIVPLNISPVSSGPVTRLRNKFEDRLRGEEAYITEEDKENNESVKLTQKLDIIPSQPEPTEVYIIPDDSWDAVDDSF